MREIVRHRILAKYNHTCCYCGSMENLEIDHIIPISKGGREDESNMQVLCKKCNMSKFNSVNILDWMEYDFSQDCIYINRDIPLQIFKPHEVKAAIEMLLKYGNGN
jgi:NMD protein affecting ribosome stability and mRNA decay